MAAYYWRLVVFRCDNAILRIHLLLYRPYYMAAEIKTKTGALPNSAGFPGRNMQQHSNKIFEPYWYFANISITSPGLVNIGKSSKRKK